MKNQKKLSRGLRRGSSGSGHYDRRATLHTTTTVSAAKANSGPRLTEALDESDWKSEFLSLLRGEVGND